MTMKRDEKAGHQDVLAGRVRVDAQSPKLRAQMRAEHGTVALTAKAYREHRMGRGAANVEFELEQWMLKRIHGHRKVTRKV